MTLSCKMENAWHHVLRKNQQSTVILMGGNNKKSVTPIAEREVFVMGAVSAAAERQREPKCRKLELLKLWPCCT